MDMMLREAEGDEVGVIEAESKERERRRRRRWKKAELEGREVAGERT